MQIKIYLVNGNHIDVDVPKDAKMYAEAIIAEGVWGEERGEEILYPPSQIFRIRIVKEKPTEKPARGSK